MLEIFATSWFPHNQLHAQRKISQNQLLMKHNLKSEFTIFCIFIFIFSWWFSFTSKQISNGWSTLILDFCSNFQNERPSVENIPQDIAPFLQSCWAEDPANRPEFMQITNFLVDFLQNLCSAQITPAQTFEIEHPRSNVTADSAGSNHPISKVSGKMKARSPLPCFLRCFDDCLPDWGNLDSFRWGSENRFGFNVKMECQSRWQYISTPGKDGLDRTFVWLLTVVQNFGWKFKNKNKENKRKKKKKKKTTGNLSFKSIWCHFLPQSWLLLALCFQSACVFSFSQFPC